VAARAVAFCSLHRRSTCFRMRPIPLFVRGITDRTGGSFPFKASSFVTQGFDGGDSAAAATSTAGQAATLKNCGECEQYGDDRVKRSFLYQHTGACSETESCFAGR